MNAIMLSEQQVIQSNAEAALLDLGDGIACLEFRSKGNSITPLIKEFFAEVLATYMKNFDGLVIGNQAKNFSVGANLNVMKGNLDKRDFVAFEKNISTFQQLNQKIKYYSKPIVSAVHRHTLGGGLEIAMHCHRRVALSKSHMGLVEAGVGLIPGGGGTKECALLIGKTTDSERADTIFTVFEKLLLRKVSANAQDARALLYLQNGDAVIEEGDLLIATGKQHCATLIREGHTSKAEIPVILPGHTAYDQMLKRAEALLEEQRISPYDFEIGKRLATVLSGGRPGGAQVMTEEKLLGLERECFLDLVHQQGTYDRISYFLQHNELLRN